MILGPHQLQVPQCVALAEGAPTLSRDACSKPRASSFFGAMGKALASESASGAAQAGLGGQTAAQGSRSARTASAGKVGKNAATAEADSKTGSRSAKQRGGESGAGSAVQAASLVVQAQAKSTEQSTPANRSSSERAASEAGQSGVQSSSRGEGRVQLQAVGVGGKPAIKQVISETDKQRPARGGSAPVVLSRPQAALRERGAESPPTVEPQKQGRTPVPKPAASSAVGGATAKSVPLVAASGQAAHAGPASEPVPTREGSRAEDGARAADGAHWQYRLSQSRDSSGGGSATAAGGRGTAQGNGTPQKPPTGRGGSGKAGLTDEASAAGNVSNWRQYVAQAGSAPSGVVQSTVRQAVADVHGQIVQQAQYIRRSGQSEVTVQLQPPEMGRMRIAVEMRDGKLDVQIKIENPQVREAMRAELDGLSRTLRAAELDLGRVEVSDYEPNQHGGRQGASADGDSPSAGTSSETLEAEERPRASGWAVFTAAGGVDCFI